MGSPDDELLRSYLPWLRVVAGNLMGFEHPSLDDFVQEGYIAMWRALKTHNPEAAPLDYWLKIKAHNRLRSLARGDNWFAHDGVRGQKSAPDAPDDTVAVLELLAGPELLDSVAMAYHRGEIAAAIDRLTPQQRKYVIARFWLGLSGREMVELGVFSYDPSALWNSRKNGARWKLEAELQHLAAV